MDGTELIARCQRGESAGFEALYLTYYRDVYAAARRIVGDAALAEDVAQEAFIKAFRHIDSLRCCEALSAWLRQVACREAYTALRRRATGSRYVTIEHELDVTPDPAPGPETTAESWELSAAVQRGLGRLDPEMRRVLQMYYFEHKPVEEIARLLSCPDGTIKSRLFRARQALRRHLPPGLTA